MVATSLRCIILSVQTMTILQPTLTEHYISNRAKSTVLRSGQSMRLILRLRREKRGAKRGKKNVQTKSVRGVMNTPEKAFPLMGQSSLAMGTSSVLS